MSKKRCPSRKQHVRNHSKRPHVSHLGYKTLVCLSTIVLLFLFKIVVAFILSFYYYELNSKAFILSVLFLLLYNLFQQEENNKVYFQNVFMQYKLLFYSIDAV